MVLASVLIALLTAFGAGWFCGFQHYARNVRKAQEAVLRTMTRAGLRLHKRSELDGILIKHRKE